MIGERASLLVMLAVTMTMLILVYYPSVCEAQGEGPIMRPARPAHFQGQGEVKAYLEKLREWVEDSVRGSSRYGKRNFGSKIVKSELNKERVPKWKSDYDYYSQYMNI